MTRSLLRPDLVCGGSNIDVHGRNAVIAEEPFQIADPDVNVIVVTGAEAQHERLPGILGVLTKPVQAETVLTAVDDVINAFQ